MEKIVLIDGHSILNRAFFGLPLLSNAEGLHTNAVYGFLNIMFKILDEEEAGYLAVAFDVHAPTFRHGIFEAYKGTRKPMQDELREQVPVMKDVLRAMHICTFEQEGFEADDIIGTLADKCEKAGMEVSVISGDRDLLQLATDKVRIRIPKTKMSGTQIEDYYAKDVFEKYGVTPKEFIDLKALMGDASDNIPGVPGIGEKTAGKIISAYHSIEEAYAHADEIKPKKASENLKTFYDQAVLSKVLAAIKTDCDIDFDPEKTRIHDLLNEESYKLFKRLELKNILKRFENIDSAAGTEQMSAAVLEDAGQIQSWADGIPRGSSLGIYYFSEPDCEGASVAVNGREPVIIFTGGLVTSAYLRGLIEDLAGKAETVSFVNLKEQLTYINIGRNTSVFDAAIAAYLLNPLKDGYTYDSIALDHLGLTIPSRADLLKKMTNSQAKTECPDLLMKVLAYEAVIPLQVREKLEQALIETGMKKLFDEVEMPLLFILYEMEKAGIHVEREELKRYGDALVSRIETLEAGIYDLAGEEFNINSPKQLGVILFEKLNLPFAKKTKTGYSTSADILEKLADKDPIIPMILEYRQLTKLKSTYADGLAAYIDPADERIHGKFNQTITATGRISSTEPNLQNIPVRMELGRMIRKVFVPEPGRVFVNADYSQIELRVLAHMAGDEQLINAYKEARDIHALTASQVFHVPLSEVTPLMRRNAKAVNFGIIYGISSFGLSQDLSISRKEADAYIKKYFETYPGIKQFLDNAVSEAKEKGYAVTLFGRRRPVPELASNNFMQRAFGERVAMNSPIQGTAADIIKIAMVHVADRLKRENLKSRLILQIHDELLIEAEPEEVEIVKRILPEEMEHAVTLSVPLTVDMNQGDNWYELK